jgi:Fic family protein
MRVEDFSEAQRQYLRRLGDAVVAFVPPPIPRRLVLDTSMINQLAEANRALGKLDGTGRHLPNPHLLISPYLRREAVLSSRIEGTQTGLSQLLLLEAGAQPTVREDDAREVINYVRALEWALDELPRLPVSLRLVREIHRRLMEGVRGGEKTPGEFRRFQNFVAPRGTPIERATFVPPPPGDELDRALDDWEKFIHEDDDLPLLLRCGLMHYQFETIHPFADGNGRVGRLLIPLLLLERNVLSQPLLYVSAYLEQHRDDYYATLTSGRITGDLMPWLRLFLAAVRTQADDAADRADRLTALRESYHAQVVKSRGKIVHPLIDRLFRDVIVTAPAVAKAFDVTYPTALGAITELVSIGILKERTGQRRYRVYVAVDIFDILMPEETFPVD